jgi:hypothetical protein
MNRSKANKHRRLLWWLGTGAAVLSALALANWFQRTSPSIVFHMIDLSSVYNSRTTNSPLDFASDSSPNNLADFPTGVAKFGKTPFDPRGIVQLAGMAPVGFTSRFPDKVEGIPVGQPCRAISILHGTGGWTAEGKPIAVLVLRYENGIVRSIPIVYGRHLRDWWQSNQDSGLAPGTAIAWTGQNDYSRLKNTQLRIYKTTLQNPMSAVTIESIDYISTLSSCAPFLLAMTLEQ